MSTLTIWNTLLWQLLKYKLCFRHHLAHSCNPEHCLTLLSGTRLAGGRGKIEEFREKILSTSGSLSCDPYFPAWSIPSSWCWILAVITSTSALIIVVYIPQKSRAEFFFWNRKFIWCTKQYTDFAVYRSACSLCCVKNNCLEIGFTMFMSLYNAPYFKF